MVSIKDTRYQLLKTLFKPFAQALCPTAVSGLEHIPTKGPGLIICNHRSTWDPFLVSAQVRRPISWVMAPFVSSLPLFGQLAHSVGNIPLIPEGDKAEQLIQDMIKVWSQGRLVGLFPEGMQNFFQTVDPIMLSPFKNTFVKAVLEAQITQLPIIPACIYPIRERVIGTVDTQLLQLLDPQEKLLPHQSFSGALELVGYQSIKIQFGEPIYLDPFYDYYTPGLPGVRDAQESLLNELTLLVEKQIQLLLLDVRSKSQ
jgi:1-acyl-sn-glycerol-3-phosphate acyltransferase